MTKLIVTAHFFDGTDKSKVVYADEAYQGMRDLLFRLASSGEIVSLTVTKDDVVTRLMNGNLKMKED